MSPTARELSGVPDGSIDLVVTSPPYPMIAMWDEQFSLTSPAAAAALDREDGEAAFEAMHGVLDDAWDECARVLREGGIACVNIGDAVRTIAGRFRLFANHARILTALAARGLSPLPLIVWRKPTNAPNKFMGSGMLPGGAYVTLEHEYVLIARKGGPRRPPDEAERARRRGSALFWEERNVWFSDLWSIVGARQRLAAHEAYLATRDKPPAHWNEHLGVAVVTRQETDLRLPVVDTVEERDGKVITRYRDGL